MDDLRGKRALVTGAGRGIGRAIAIALAKLRVQVVAIGKTALHLENLRQEESTIEIHVVDLADWQATRSLLLHVLPIQLVVNNAGVAVLAPALSATPEQFDLTMNVNVKAAINVIQVVAEDLQKRGMTGSIVNISSQASCRHLDQHLTYCASKAALDQVTRSFAVELGPSKIRVNAVNPTVVLTDLGRKAWSDPDKSTGMLSRIPLSRFAEPEEVVQPVLFLLSGNSSMMTGCCLPIEGGFWCK